MNCKTGGNLGGQQQCCGQCDSQQHGAAAGHTLEMELEWRAQERIAIAEMVDQAHHLIQEVLGGERGVEVLHSVSGQLARASQLLNWPTPFDPAQMARNA